MTLCAKASLAAAMLLATSQVAVAQSGLPNIGVPSPSTVAGRAVLGSASGKSSGFLSNIFSCDASGDSEVIGAAGGAAVGGLVGNRLLKGSRTIGALAGAGLGAAAGSWMGCRLQRSAQLRAERAAQAAATTGTTQSWSDPESGASGSVSASAQEVRSLNGMKLQSGVAPEARYVPISGNFVAAKNLNVRSAAQASAPIRYTVPRGQTMSVRASTTDGAWYLVERDGLGVGYASATVLQRRTGTNAGCKRVTQTIRQGDRSETEVLNACPSADGGWTFAKS